MSDRKRALEANGDSVSSKRLKRSASKLFFSVTATDFNPHSDVSHFLPLSYLKGELAFSEYALTCFYNLFLLQTSSNASTPSSVGNILIGCMGITDFINRLLQTLSSLLRNGQR